MTVLMSPLLCASCICCLLFGWMSAAVPGDAPSVALLVLYLPLLSVLAGVIFPRTVVSLCPPHATHYCVVCLLLCLSVRLLCSPLFAASCVWLVSRGSFQRDRNLPTESRLELSPRPQVTDHLIKILVLRLLEKHYVRQTIQLWNVKIHTLNSVIT